LALGRCEHRSELSKDFLRLGIMPRHLSHARQAAVVTTSVFIFQGGLQANPVFPKPGSSLLLQKGICLPLLGGVSFFDLHFAP
jgi:hypothetical protein